MTYIEFLDAADMADHLLACRGEDDARRGIPMRTEAIAYGQAYDMEKRIRAVESGEAILCLSDAILCRDCGHLDVGPQHYGCGCARGNVLRRVAGMITVFNAEYGDSSPFFMSNSVVAGYLRTGIPVIDIQGNNLSDNATQIQ